MKRTPVTSSGVPVLRLPRGATRYRVASVDQEHACEWCGMPAFVGDWAVMLADERSACSVSCAMELSAAEVPS